MESTYVSHTVLLVGTSFVPAWLGAASVVDDTVTDLALQHAMTSAVEGVI